MKIHKYDTVIVGAGGAGMRAAIESTKRSRTAVLTKLYPTRSHTGAAQGGMAAALANVEEDNWEWHTFDTVKGGDYLVDQDAAEILAKEAIDSVLDLEKMGLPFNRTPNGTIDQRRFGGHSRNHGEAQRPATKAKPIFDTPPSSTSWISRWPMTRTTSTTPDRRMKSQAAISKLPRVDFGVFLVRLRGASMRGAGLSTL